MDEGMILDCMKCKRWNLFSEYYHIKGHFANIRCDDIKSDFLIVRKWLLVHI